MKTLLVTGASGFLGPTLCEKAAAAWDVVAAMHRHRIAIPHARVTGVNLAAYSEVRELFEQIRPDAVIHAAALSNTEYCQAHPEESEAINVEASINLAGLAADRGIPFVFTSTDLVFDGEHAPYAEESAVGPISVYGEHKARARVGDTAAAPGRRDLPAAAAIGPSQPARVRAFWRRCSARCKETRKR